MFNRKTFFITAFVIVLLILTYFICCFNVGGTTYYIWQSDIEITLSSDLSERDMEKFKRMNNINKISVFVRDAPADMSFLKKIHGDNVEYLEIAGLYGNPSDDLSFLSYFKNLKEIKLSFYNCSDFKALSQVENLNSIYIWYSETENFEGVDSLKSLQKLEIFESYINDFSALENSNIEELYISKCHSDSFSGIECLAQMPAMKKIKLPEGILSESDKRLLVEKGVEVSVYN